MAENFFDLTATTFSGLEEILAEELVGTGAVNIVTGRRAVTFQGDLRVLYTANYTLRTAIRILKPMYSFNAGSPDALYSEARKIDWSRLMDVGNSFIIDPVVSGEIFRHSRYAAQKLKDAIVDQFHTKFRQRPTVVTENPEIRIHLLIRNDQCQVSLDSSGESLHKRGYRKFGGKAPLNEILAAGMLKIAGWDASRPLVDPMCGSGTLLTEAAMIGRNIPAGRYRKEWSFMHWPDYHRMLWRRIRDEQEKKINSEVLDIRGSDIDKLSVSQAIGNLESIGMHELIPVREADIRDTAAHCEKGMFITNPPYDIRVKEDQLRLLYRDIGNVLKKGYKGWEAWLFSAKREALKNTGMKPEQNVILFNGPLECRFAQYHMLISRR